MGYRATGLDIAMEMEGKKAAAKQKKVSPPIRCCLLSPLIWDNIQSGVVTL